MKITYTPNPLNTMIELDAHEIEVLRLKIRIKEMEDLLYDAHFHMTHDKFIDHDKVKKALDPDYYIEEDNEVCGLDKRVQVLLDHYLEELKSSHSGDCTCFACSCSKCHAESILGIDTIKGLGKHQAHKILGAFSYKDGDAWKERSMDEALEILRTYDPQPTTGSGWDKVGGFEAHVPRWKSEAAVAYTWLLKYRNEHFEQGDGGEHRH